MTDTSSPRYAELYWHYHAHYLASQAESGATADESAASAYAHEQAAAAYEAEQKGAPAGADESTASDVAASAGTAAEPGVAAAPVASASKGATGGSVPPVAPPPAPGGAAHGSPEASSTDSSKKGLIRGLVIGGIAAVVVAALGVTAAFVVPGLTSGGGAHVSRVVDLQDEPDTVWSFDAPDDDYLDASVDLIGIDGQRIVVVSRFDYYEWQSDNADTNYYPLDWYAGVDEDYEIGWEAAEEYNAAYDIWLSDFDADYPDDEDYWPAEFQGVDPWYADLRDLTATPHAGAFAGWSDARYGDSHGASLPPKPKTAEDNSSLALVNDKGDELWSVELSEILPDHDPERYFSVVPVGDGGSQLVVFDLGGAYGDDVPDSVVALVNVSDGSVAETTEWDGAISSATTVGSTFVAVTIDEDGDGEVSAFDVSSLDSDPKWTSSVQGDYPSVSRFDDQTVKVSAGPYDDRDISYLSAADGEETEWSDDLDFFTIDDTLVSVERDDDEYELTAYGRDGKSKWDLTTDYYFIVDGALFIADRDEVSPVDLGNGELRWDSGVDEGYPVGIFGNKVLFQLTDDGDLERQLIWVSLSSGEELDDDAPKLPKDVSASSTWLGERTVYVLDSREGELLAYSLDKSKERWSYSLDDASLRVIHDQFYLWDSGKRRLSLLGES